MPIEYDPYGYHPQIQAAVKAMDDDQAQQRQLNSERLDLVTFFRQLSNNRKFSEDERYEFAQAAVALQFLNKINLRDSTELARLRIKAAELKKRS